eukprot:731266-Amphidinium_carterae.2
MTGQGHTNNKGLQNILQHRGHLVGEVLHRVSVSAWFDRVVRKRNDRDWSDLAAWRSKACPCAGCDKISSQEVALETQSSVGDSENMTCSEVLKQLVCVCVLDSQTLPLSVHRTNIYDKAGHALRGMHFGIQLQR